MSILSKKFFHDEKAAFAHLESILWADGVVCPHCGSVDRAGKLNGVKRKDGTVRHGLWKCYEKACRKQFTVRVGTVFECAHVPLPKMLQAVYLMTASKKGISAHQLHHTLEVQYKTAWFLAHRIREAMRDGIGASLGGPGKVVEADETFIGKLEGWTKASYGPAKNVVLTLVERGGSARSFHVDGTRLADIVPVVRANISRESKLMTDEGPQYKAVRKEYADGSGAVSHKSEEYARGEVHTNTVEGFYSIFKRGMKGIYQHCKEKHLHRYLAEFDFRYSNRIALGIDDQARAGKALKGVVGKRLTCRGPRSTGNNP
jgi:transposase-like protein